MKGRVWEVWMCLRYSEADLKVLVGWEGQVVGVFVAAEMDLVLLVILLVALEVRVGVRFVVGDVEERLFP